MTEKDNSISRESLFEAIVKEAGEFYSLIVKVSSLFLAGSLVFLNYLKKNQGLEYVTILFFGWFLLVLAIALAAFIRLKNLESGKLALSGDFEKARKLDENKELMSTLMTWSMIIGITLLLIFGYTNLT